MNKTELTTYLQENNLLLVNKTALLDLLAENNVLQLVDNRVKWITLAVAKAKYGVTRYWLNQCENDSKSLLRVNPGNHKNSKKKYNEQSIIDELKRQAV